MRFLQLDANRKKKFGLGNGHHLAGFGFVGVKVGTGLNHDLNRDPIFANLLHEVFLGQDANDCRNTLHGTGGGYPQEKKGLN
jgi:hypothetical protein